MFQSIIKTDYGFEATLHCTAFARPTAEVVWLQEQTILGSSDKYTMETIKHKDLPGNSDSQSDNRREDDLVHVLKISRVSESDFGTFTCRATNSYGETTAFIHLTGNFMLIKGN